MAELLPIVLEGTLQWKSFMPYQDIAPLPKQMTIMIGLCVVGAMAFGLALSYYKNTLFDQQLVLMEVRNAKLKQEIVSGYQDLEYYHSVQYKDKYAKENIGLVNPGEKIIIITQEVKPVELRSMDVLTQEEKQAIYEENLRSIPIIYHWSLFFFHPQKIEDLKKAL